MCCKTREQPRKVEYFKSGEGEVHGKVKGPSEGSALGQCWEEVGSPGNLLVEVGVARKSWPASGTPLK